MRLHLGSRLNRNNIKAFKKFRPQKKFCWRPRLTIDGDVIWLERAWFVSDISCPYICDGNDTVEVETERVYFLEDKPPQGTFSTAMVFEFPEEYFDRKYFYGQIYHIDFASDELQIIENLLGNPIPSWYKGDVAEFWEALHSRKDALLSIGTKGSKGCL